MVNCTNSSCEKVELKSGYDLPVYGLDSGSFYYLHIPALFCIFCSFSCVVTALTLSFRNRDYKKFFSWAKSERFVVYLAICDGGFNIFHSMDHMQYVITKDHVRPKELCEFYAFSLAEFVASQTLLVNIVAINAFTLMVLKKNINFGKYDWRLLAWTFGLPFIGATAVAVTGQLGPNGSSHFAFKYFSCFFDGVTAGTANICFTTVPLLLVLIMNSVMYAVTWKRIREETHNLHTNLRIQNITKKSKRAAKNMSMFVVAFFIQWGPLSLFGIWGLIDVNIPLPLFHIVTVFCNIGGCLNLIIYLIIRRRHSREKRKANEDTQVNSCELKTVCNDAGCVPIVKT
ncbi:uncharacterized protein LOC123562504 [Mercenaria mercenaria]|uniref:uncharacterized protein LOC123562504 n=1 Tax=Mercenaria mercenaria TaxID=6596 RepID=UPI001E1D6211|nr:uncharacterized protein LOC123562504 [Mercenaria mercenaria]